MSFVLRLLIVEDDEEQVKSWKREVDRHNADSEAKGFAIDVMSAPSLAKADSLISSHEFDAAIVDIRLDQEHMQAPNSDGNEVIGILLGKELAVVAVFTGEKGQVAIPSEGRGLVQTFLKGADEGEGTHAVMDWLNTQAHMIGAIKNAQQKIKGEMVQLFTRSIWPRWSNWVQAGEQDDYIETALSRHLASHIHAVLLEGSNQNVHPEEWYFIPPVRPGIRTGDVIKNENGGYEIVITPRCDLANEGRIDTIQLAECEEIKELWGRLCGELEGAREKLNANTDPNRVEKLARGVDDAKKKISKLVQNAEHINSSGHFLPMLQLNDGGKCGPFKVKFNSIRTVSKDDKAEIEKIEKGRIAAITPEFLPSLVERLGAYFSRIGTPNYSHPD